MTKVVFYEKPGCGGNAKQKALLIAAGHELDVRDLLAEPWTADRLRAYFGAKPVADWFNPSAPRVKSGDIDPAKLGADEALALMVAQPLLIHRPLMEANGKLGSGFGSATDLGLLQTQDMPCVGPSGCAQHPDHQH